MAEKDTNGRPYAKLSEVKVGDILEADSGFTCLKDGAQLKIKSDGGDLYVDCSGAEDDDPEEKHKHFIEGQADDGEHLVGFYKI